MKVYVVYWNYSENGYNNSSGIHCICATQELAERKVERLNELSYDEPYTWEEFVLNHE